MKFQPSERSLMVVGIAVGIMMAALSISASTSSPDHEEARARQSQLANEEASLKAKFNASLHELRRLDEEAQAPDEASRQVVLRSPAQQWAASVLASGQPLTIREMTMLSQIVSGNSQPASVPYENEGQSGYDRSVAYVNSLKPPASPRSSLDAPSASRSFLERQQATAGTYSGHPGSFDDPAKGSNPADNLGATDLRTGRYYAPAGPGAYVNTQNGTLYAPAGPNGVVDTRTGKYIPIAP